MVAAPEVEGRDARVQLEGAGGIAAPLGSEGLRDEVEVGRGHPVGDAWQPAKAGSGVPRHDSTQGPRGSPPQAARDGSVDNRRPCGDSFATGSISGQSRRHVRTSPHHPVAAGGRVARADGPVELRRPQRLDDAHRRRPPAAPADRDRRRRAPTRDRGARRPREAPGHARARGRPGLRVAFLRSRPGKGTVTDTDRAWATSLYAAARRASVPCEVVHLATRGAIRPIPADVVGIR